MQGTQRVTPGSLSRYSFAALRWSHVVWLESGTGPHCTSLWDGAHADSPGHELINSAGQDHGSVTYVTSLLMQTHCKGASWVNDNFTQHWQQSYYAGNVASR